MIRHDGTLGGSTDAFIFKLSATGNSRHYGSYHGGSAADTGMGREWMWTNVHANTEPDETVFNLTIDNLHTYFVLAGDEAVLSLSEN